MTSTLAGAQDIADPRQLTLKRSRQDGNDSQFTGDGTAEHPTLYNRDVLAFFPFQVSQNKFVAAVYVMSSDLTHYYTSSPAPGYTPYDMPPEQYQLTIGGVNGADATVSTTNRSPAPSSPRRSSPAPPTRSSCNSLPPTPLVCSTINDAPTTTPAATMGTTVVSPSAPPKKDTPTNGGVRGPGRGFG